MAAAIDPAGNRGGSRSGVTDGWRSLLLEAGLGAPPIKNLPVRIAQPAFPTVNEFLTGTRAGSSVRRASKRPFACRLKDDIFIIIVI
jgi:hypothetical protein